MRGEVHSSLNKTFFSGSRKERHQLKFGDKLGPLRRWPSDKVATLRLSPLLLSFIMQVSTLIRNVQDIAKSEGMNSSFGYAYDVLLPEVSHKAEFMH
jgi:hypothetical protein